MPPPLEHGLNLSSIVSSTSTPGGGATNDHNRVDLIPSSQSIPKYVNEEDYITNEVDEVTDDDSNDDILKDINEPARQWHCPAYQSGPGAIDWFRGLQPLMTRAKTKGSKRVKLHRELTKLLDEELHRAFAQAFSGARNS
ncbi:Zinc finger-XS domain [Dillenia turbinata]|uniref:Zinc finger-XS domain n=1 Tax=Dillenia turbinata TaxID=194707 RepID=A0AAN8VAF3_9MAGN